MKSDDRKQRDNREQIEKRVIGAIVSFIEDNSTPINGQTDLAKIYDLDSFESAGLIFGLEEKFNISISNEDADKLFKTGTNGYGLPYICSAPVSGFVDYVASRLDITSKLDN